MSDLEIIELTRKLADYQLPPHRLPLCDNRHRFAGLPADTVSTIARRALSCVERRGRLTDSVREVADRPVAGPAGDFVVFEAHIDLTDMDPDLNLKLLDLGFEPDDFAKMEPPEYRYHYTLQYVIPVPSGRLGLLQRQLTDAGTRAARLIEQHDHVTGYLELETYRSKYVSRLPFREFSAEGAGPAPVADDYQMRPVPTSRQEAAESGMSLDARRAADIHVKVPGDFHEYDGTPGSDRVRVADENHSAGRAYVRAALIARGFYEIVSEGGNYLYSAHFADLGEANAAYWQLAAYARDLGGITGVVREACTSVWRKVVVSSSGTEVFARVPPLLRSTWAREMG